jgi:hypothetical protein
LWDKIFENAINDLSYKDKAEIEKQLKQVAR